MTVSIQFRGIPRTVMGVGSGQIPAKRFYTSRRLRRSSSHLMAAIHSRFIGLVTIKECIYFDRHAEATSIIRIAFRGLNTTGAEGSGASDQSRVVYSGPVRASRRGTVSEP